MKPTALTRSRALTLGEVGERWLESLPGVVSEFTSRWDLTVGDALDGGSAGLVAGASRDDGTPVVLKIFMPQGATGAAPWRQEMSALIAAGGDPYVEVVEYDAERGVVLTERLGRALDTLELPVTEQLDVIARTLPGGWRTAPPSDLPTGGEKASYLRDYIETTWGSLHEPCARATIDTVVAFTHAREAAFDPSRAVLVHGDAHTGNVLEAEPGERSGRFKLIDPEGLASEPEHDLAIVLRQLNADLLVGDAVPLARSWCDRLASATGADARAIWEWSSIERVSTGLLLQQLGEHAPATEYLAAADRLALS